jgi:hypothetical protein
MIIESFAFYHGDFLLEQTVAMLPVRESYWANIPLEEFLQKAEKRDGGRITHKDFW